MSKVKVIVLKIGYDSTQAKPKKWSLIHDSDGRWFYTEQTMLFNSELVFYLLVDIQHKIDERAGEYNSQNPSPSQHS